MDLRDRVTPLTALVVDDREESRYVVSTWLGRAGIRVIEGATGAEALEVLANEAIDLAVLDVNLPDMSGFEIAERIRADPANEWIPIIHVSATATDIEHRAEGLLRGADAFLTEPWEPSELLSTITALVRRADLRRRALLSAERLRHLNSATADVHAASDDERVYAAAVAGASAIAAHEAVLVHLGSSGGGALLRRSRPDGTDTTEPVQRAAVAEILAPAIAGSRTLAAVESAILEGVHAGTVFMDEAGEPMGALLVPSVGPVDIDEVLALLAQLSLAVTLARVNLRALVVEHRIALVFQQSLLPQTPPEHPDVRIAFRYLAASAEAEVGGDFYEAFQLDEHHIAVAIGDVVGHSLHAATVMGEIRHAIRSYAIDGYGPIEVVTRIERLVDRFHPGMLTTMIYGVVDLREREFRFCNCGHLPPLHISAEGARYVTGHGSLIGVSAVPPPLEVVRLRAGDRVVLVTDGLLEHTRESVDAGLGRLRDAVLASRDSDVDALIDRLVHRVGPAELPTDDIAIVGIECCWG